MFWSNLTKFPRSCKSSVRPVWLSLVPKRYPHYLRCIFYRFPSAVPKLEKLKTGPRWLGFVPETYTHSLRCSFYRFSSNRLKIVSNEFWRLLRDQTPPEQAPYTVWGAVFIISRQCGWKIFWSNFADFSGPEHHRSRLSKKQGPNDSILHPKHTHPVWGAILIITVNTAEKCFGRILTTFPSPKRHQSK